MPDPQQQPMHTNEYDALINDYAAEVDTATPQTLPAEDDSGLWLKAYHIRHNYPAPIVPATKYRQWMEEFADRHPYRCLPLLMANQSGWFILAPYRVVAFWEGDPAPAALKVGLWDAPEGYQPMARSHFGAGILTWRVPYLFRTPPGYNLLFRGPANFIKAGIQPLEGLVETDWTLMPATMSWLMTHPKQFVVFEKYDPICMIVPQKRGELETVQTSYHEITDDPALMRDALVQWKSRQDFYDKRKADETFRQQNKAEWHYFHGIDRSSQGAGQHFPEHQTRRDLQTFRPDWTQPTKP